MNLKVGPDYAIACMYRFLSKLKCTKGNALFLIMWVCVKLLLYPTNGQRLVSEILCTWLTTLKNDQSTATPNLQPSLNKHGYTFYETLIWTWLDIFPPNLVDSFSFFPSPFEKYWDKVLAMYRLLFISWYYAARVAAMRLPKLIS